MKDTHFRKAFRIPFKGRSTRLPNNPLEVKIKCRCMITDQRQILSAKQRMKWSYWVT